MARALSDILRRFRPAVAPGPAGPAGVPADRVAEAAAELAPVFAALERAVADGRLLREAARADAHRRRRHATEEAEQIVAEVRGQLDAVRAEAASARLTALDAERASLEAEARAEADRVRQVAGARLPAVVAQVVAGVQATADPATGMAAEASRGGVAG